MISGAATGQGMLACPPHLGEDPGKVRHQEACAAIGSRNPGPLVVCTRAGAAADVPKGVEVPLHLSLLIQPSRDFKVYRNEMESARGEKENQPIGFG